MQAPCRCLPPDVKLRKPRKKSLKKALQGRPVLVDDENSGATFNRKGPTATKTREIDVAINKKGKKNKKNKNKKMGRNEELGQDRAPAASTERWTKKHRSIDIAKNLWHDPCTLEIPFVKIFLTFRDYDRCSPSPEGGADRSVEINKHTDPNIETRWWEQSCLEHDRPKRSLDRQGGKKMTMKLDHSKCDFTMEPQVSVTGRAKQSLEELVNQPVPGVVPVPRGICNCFATPKQVASNFSAQSVSSTTEKATNAGSEA